MPLEQRDSTKDTYFGEATPGDWKVYQANEKYLVASSFRWGEETRDMVHIAICDRLADAILIAKAPKILRLLRCLKETVFDGTPFALRDEVRDSVPALVNEIDDILRRYR